MYITLTPALDLNQLWETPVTELCPFTFSTAMSGPEHKQLNQDLIAMRADALNANKMDGIRPRFWSMGHVDRPGKRIHPDSSSGEAFVVLAVIGWESIEDHKRIREAEGYKWHMERNEGKLLPTGPGLLPGEGLGLSHVRFKGV